MNERILKKVSAAGIWSLTLGIVVLATGIISGVLMLINAARLLKLGNGIMS